MSESGNPGANGRRVMDLDKAKRHTRKTDYIEIEGYEDPFRVQELTYGERVKAIKMGPQGKDASDLLLMPRIVAFGWINEEGARVVEPVGGTDQVSDLLASEVIEKLYERIAAMSGFAKESRDEMGKVLKETPAASGG